jgi:hypothetical protein
LRRIVLLSSETITDFEITQNQPGALRVHFVLSAERSQTTIEKVGQSLRTNAEGVLMQYGCKASSIDIVEGLLPRRKDQKRRRVHRIG